MSLFIDNYEFGFKSVFIPEYGPRHLEKAHFTQGMGKLTHQVIGVLECCPVLGHIVSLIEGLAHICFSTLYRSFHKPRSFATTASLQTIHSPNRFEGIVSVERAWPELSTESASTSDSSGGLSVPISGETDESSAESPDDRSDPVLDKITEYISCQNTYDDSEETTRSNLEKLWYVPFLGFCLQEQPKKLRKSLEEQASKAYPILQFVWIQWAVVQYQSKKPYLSQSQDVVDLHAKVNDWISKLEASQAPNTIKPANFKPVIFNEDQIKKLLPDEDDEDDDDKSFVDILNEILAEHPNQKFLVTIAQKGAEVLTQSFEQFQVVKSGLQLLFSISA